MKQIRAKNILKYVLLTSMIFAGASAIDYSNSESEYVSTGVYSDSEPVVDYTVKKVQSTRYTTSAVVNYEGQDHLLVSGEGTSGQVGISNSSTKNLLLPYEFVYPEIYEGKEIVDYSLGWDHSGMVLKSPDGTNELWMWGKGYSGQLGAGPEADTSEFVSPIKISGPWEEWETGYEITQLECGTRSTFAVVNDGTTDHLFAWGENNNGTLGLGDTSKRQTPTEVTFDGLTNFTVEEIVEKNNSRTVMSVIHDDIENQDHLYVWGTNRWFSSELFGTTNQIANTPTDLSLTDEITGELISGEYSNLRSTVNTSWFVFTDDLGVEHLYAIGYNTNGILSDVSGLEIGGNATDFVELWNSEDDTEYVDLISFDTTSAESIAIMEDELGDVHVLTAGQSTGAPNGSTWFAQDASDWQPNKWNEAYSISEILNEEEFMMMATGDAVIRFATDDGAKQHIYTIGRGASGEIGDGKKQNVFTPTELVIDNYEIPEIEKGNFDMIMLIIAVSILIIFLILAGSIYGFIHYEHNKNREIHWFRHGHLFEVDEMDKEEEKDEK